MRKTIFIFLSLETIISCREKTDRLPNKENQGLTEVQAALNDSIHAPFSFMKVPMEALPVHENTNFRNFDEAYRKKHHPARIYTKLTDEQVEKLGLQKWLESGKNVTVNYQLSYPGNFKTFVFTYQEKERKLNTMMVTFDKNYKKLDELLVAYDGSSESTTTTTSSISHTNIVVKNFYRSTRGSEITNTSYLIRETGNIEIRKK